MALIRSWVGPGGALPRVFLASGDFRQIGPVVKNGGHCDVVDASIKSSESWDLFEFFSLSQPMRTKDDPEYDDFVSCIGDATLKPPYCDPPLRQIPEMLIKLPTTPWMPDREVATPDGKTVKVARVTKNPQHDHPRLRPPTIFQHTTSVDDALKFVHPSLFP